MPELDGSQNRSQAAPEQPPRSSPSHTHTPTHPLHPTAALAHGTCSPRAEAVAVAVPKGRARPDWGAGPARHSPLCSPRKTSLNFRSGLPKSPPADMMGMMGVVVIHRCRRKRRRRSGRREGAAAGSPRLTLGWGGRRGGGGRAAPPQAFSSGA